MQEFKEYLDSGPEEVKNLLETGSVFLQQLEKSINDLGLQEYKTSILIEVGMILVGIEQSSQLFNNFYSLGISSEKAHSLATQITDFIPEKIWALLDIYEERIKRMKDTTTHKIQESQPIEQKEEIESREDLIKNIENPTLIKTTNLPTQPLNTDLLANKLSTTVTIPSQEKTAQTPTIEQKKYRVDPYREPIE